MIREITDAKLSGDPKWAERAKGIFEEFVIAFMTGMVLGGGAGAVSKKPVEKDEGLSKTAVGDLPPEEEGGLPPITPKVTAPKSPLEAVKPKPKPKKATKKPKVAPSKPCLLYTSPSPRDS